MRFFQAILFPSSRRQLNNLYNMGKGYINEGKLTEAKQCFEKVLTLNPNCEGARYKIIDINKKLPQQEANTLNSLKSKGL